MDDAVNLINGPIFTFVIILYLIINLKDQMRFKNVSIVVTKLFIIENCYFNLVSKIFSYRLLIILKRWRTKVGYSFSIVSFPIRLNTKYNKGNKGVNPFRSLLRINDLCWWFINSDLISDSSTMVPVVLLNILSRVSFRSLQYETLSEVSATNVDTV